LGERRTDFFFVEVEIIASQRPQALKIELARRDDVGLFQSLCQREIKRRRGNPVRDRGERRHQPAITVPYQARIAGESKQSRDGGIAQPDVQHRLEHTRHGDGGARAHRNQQRLARATEAEPA